jgi:hypothetical protein
MLTVLETPEIIDEWNWDGTRMRLNAFRTKANQLFDLKLEVNSVGEWVGLDNSVIAGILANRIEELRAEQSFAIAA